MEKIVVRFFTNLDLFERETWPTVFACKPQIGEFATAESGRYLRIVAIWHCVDKNKDPYLRVELHT
jgi:hypothetical protein